MNFYLFQREFYKHKIHKFFTKIQILHIISEQNELKFSKINFFCYN